MVIMKIKWNNAGIYTLKIVPGTEQVLNKLQSLLSSVAENVLGLIRLKKAFEASAFIRWWNINRALVCEKSWADD